MSEKKRSNLWVCIFYPDSCPKNFLTIIQEWVLPVLISPLHDSDKNSNDTEKKPHYHLMIDFGSGQNKSIDQVRAYTDKLNGTIPIICNNRWSMIRYFIHADNPEKAQYKIDDLIKFGGFEYEKAFETYTNETMLYKFIENIIYENMIYNYAILCKYLSDNNLEYELQFLRKHTLHFNSLLIGYYQLIISNRQKLLDNLKKSI